MGRLNTEFTHPRLSPAELADLLRDVSAGKNDHFSYDWDFYRKWFGYRPSDAPEHIEMSAIVVREIDVCSCVRAGGIPWNLAFAGEPQFWAGSDRWAIMVKARGYSFGVFLTAPGERLL